LTSSAPAAAAHESARAKAIATPIFPCMLTS